MNNVKPIIAHITIKKKNIVSDINKYFINKYVLELLANRHLVLSYRSCWISYHRILHCLSRHLMIWRQYMKEIDTILNEEIKMRQTICSFSNLHIVVSKHNDDHILIHTFGILNNVLILLVCEIYMFYKDFFTCTSHHHNISCIFTRIHGNLIALCVQEMLHKLYSIPKSIISPN